MLIPRHQRILALLNERGFISSGEAAKLFGVTPMTVWRDFRLLEELGLLRRVRGGVRDAGSAVQEPAFEAKERAARECKHRIAEAAVHHFVRDGYLIALEGGTTVATLVNHLPGQRISIITNSLPIAAQLRAARPNLPVRVIGGWLSPVSGNLTGSEAMREASQFTPDVCFISASGFDAELGPTDPNPMEVEVKRAFAAASRKVVLLLNGEKFGRRAASVTIHPKHIDALVTDSQPPSAILQRLRHENIQLILA